MARVPFSSIFDIHTDGTIEPRQTVRIGGVTLSPGARFARGNIIGGVDLVQYANHDLEVTTDDGTAVITGIY